jgi:hypothetical protein
VLIPVNQIRTAAPALYLDLKYYREDAEKWFADTSIVELFLQGLRKLGLKDFVDSSE